jgi:glycosyltransferase involved in cell wall biosynthesis
VYPSDPVDEIVGGIDTYIHGVIRWAPADFDVSVVGVTTNPGLRPVGKWSQVDVAGRSIELFPALFLKSAEKQGRIPLSFRFTVSLLRSMPRIEADVLEFHRIEPSIALLRDLRPKTIVIHQNMDALSRSSVRWKYAPGVFFRLERYLLPKMSSIVCVRSEAARQYQEKYPDLADRIRFGPTWVDPEVFTLPNGDERQTVRRHVRKEFGFGSEDPVVVTVGRLDKEKNPELLLQAFKIIRSQLPETRLLFIGNGVLEPKLRQLIAGNDLQSSVVITGIKTRAQVCRYLWGADLFVLSSVYEGMPMSLLEALGTGLPAVSTSVGEVSRIIAPGINGELVENHEPDAVAHSMLKCLNRRDIYSPENCATSVNDYTPAKVLAKTFDLYRQLSQRRRT